MKKTYMAPTTNVVKIETRQILAASGDKLQINLSTKYNADDGEDWEDL
ncbi:MAG: hypothetical protein IJ710_05460 [Prevotella sp.]|nr:hypothetical protein [Prevotella sp.]MBR1917607.1 hypothetical protein [Bacteroidaceae bacterium]